MIEETAEHWLATWADRLGAWATEDGEVLARDAHAEVERMMTRAHARPAGKPPATRERDDNPTLSGRT